MTAMCRRDSGRAGPRALALLVLVGTAVAVSSCTGAEGEAQPTQAADAGVVGSQSAGAQSGSGEPAPSQTSSGAGASVDPAGVPSGGPTIDSPASPDSSGPDPAGVALSVDAALRALAEEQDAVTRDQVRAAIERGFAAAGAVPEALEVSIDRTPTGLDVDAIQGSGLIGGQCVVSEIREGVVTVTVLPVLATGLCFVGDQR